MPFTTSCHTLLVDLRWKMYIACGALFRYILKGARVAFHRLSALRKTVEIWIFQTRIQPFSVQSLQEGVLEFKIFTIDIRMFWVNESFLCKSCKLPETRISSWGGGFAITCWLLNVLPPCQCISRADLFTWLCTSPHWGRECPSNLLFRPVCETDTGRTSPSTDPIAPGPWQGSRWIASFEVTGMTWHGHPSPLPFDGD